MSTPPPQNNEEPPLPPAEPVAPTQAPPPTFSLADSIPEPDIDPFATMRPRPRENFRQSLNEFLQRKLLRPLDEKEIIFDTVQVDHQRWRCQIMIPALRDPKVMPQSPTYEGRIERSIKDAVDRASREALEKLGQLDKFGISSVVLQKEHEKRLALTRLVEKGEISLQQAFAHDPNYKPPISVLGNAEGKVKLCNDNAQQSIETQQGVIQGDPLSPLIQAILTPCNVCQNLPENCICVPALLPVEEKVRPPLWHTREAPEIFYRPGPPGLMPWEICPDPRFVPRCRAAGVGEPVFKPWEYKKGPNDTNWSPAKILRIKWERDRVLGFTEVYLDEEGFLGKPGTLWERVSINPEAQIFWRIRVFSDGTKNSGHGPSARPIAGKAMNSEGPSSSQQPKPVQTRPPASTSTNLVRIPGTNLWDNEPGPNQWGTPGKYGPFQWKVWNPMSKSAQERNGVPPTQEDFAQMIGEIDAFYKIRASCHQSISALRVNVETLKHARNTTPLPEWRKILDRIDELCNTLNSTRHIFDGAE